MRFRRLHFRIGGIVLSLSFQAFAQQAPPPPPAGSYPYGNPYGGGGAPPAPAPAQYPPSQPVAPAQPPYNQAPYPPQPPYNPNAPQPPYNPGPYAPQPQPPYNPGPYAPQPVPGPMQPPYGQPQYANGPNNGYAPTPIVPLRSRKRSNDEMIFLYGTSALYGIGTGVWIDSLFKTTDPGLAVIAPIILGAAAPAGIYIWDYYGEFNRGVPASMATGIFLGALEGAAISGTQWQHASSRDAQWSFATESTLTFLTATGGAVGGYAFGEWFRPDPRSLSFIVSGAGWGAITGTLFGAGISNRYGDWKDGGSIGGLIGYNVGLVATGVLSTFYTPSYNAQKWLWLGYGAGVAASSSVYLVYWAAGKNASYGLIANAVGGLGGLVVAAVLAGANQDDSDTQSAAKRGIWKPPFQLGYASTGHGGGMLTASGEF